MILFGTVLELEILILLKLLLRNKKMTNCYVCDFILDDLDYYIDRGEIKFCSEGCYSEYAGCDNYKQEDNEDDNSN
jgi:hypothetical protein